MRKAVLAAAALLLMVPALAGCTKKQSGSPETETEHVTEAEGTTEAESTETAEESSAASLYTDFKKKDFYTDYQEEEYTEIELTDKSVTISKEGTYVLSGTLQDGQIIVRADKQSDVRLVLNGVDISCKKSAPILIESADKVIISLVPGTVNSLTDYQTGVSSDGKEITGCIYSKKDLTINGSGTLKIRANAKDGIGCKDTLKIMEGTIDIEAADDGIVGKEELIIRDGNIHVVSQSNGLKASETTDETLGYIYILNGNLVIESEGDAIQAETSVVIDGGTFDLTAGGGIEAAGAHEKDGFRYANWNKTIETEDTAAMGVKAGGYIEITGGSFAVNASDDAFHTGGAFTVNGGSFEIETGDDALHAKGDLVISDGEVNIVECWEGLEGGTITLEGGSVSMHAGDDGLNATGDKKDAQEAAGRFGFGMREDPFTPVEGAAIVINGGVLYIDSEGDGIDSNGDLYLNGGEISIAGTASGGDGYFDCQGTFYLNGGKIIAIGSAEMIDFPGQAEQVFLTGTELYGSKGDTVTVTDQKGNTLLSITATRSFESVFISHPDIRSEEDVTLQINGENEKLKVEETAQAMPIPEGPGNPGGPGKPEGGMPQDGMEPPEMPGDGMEPPEKPEDGKRP